MHWLIYLSKSIWKIWERKICLRIYLCENTRLTSCNRKLILTDWLYQLTTLPVHKNSFRLWLCQCTVHTNFVFIFSHELNWIKNEKKKKNRENISTCPLEDGHIRHRIRMCCMFLLLLLLLLPFTHEYTSNQDSSKVHCTGTIGQSTQWLMSLMANNVWWMDFSCFNVYNNNYY